MLLGAPRASNIVRLLHGAHAAGAQQQLRRSSTAHSSTAVSSEREQCHVYSRRVFQCFTANYSCVQCTCRVRAFTRFPSSLRQSTSCSPWHVRGPLSCLHALRPRLPATTFSYLAAERSNAAMMPHVSERSSPGRSSVSGEATARSVERQRRLDLTSRTSRPYIMLKSHRPTRRDTTV